MISLTLDLKIETYTDESTRSIIEEELRKDLEIFHKKCSNKASEIVLKRNRLKLFQPIGA